MDKIPVRVENTSSNMRHNDMPERAAKPRKRRRIVKFAIPVVILAVVVAGLFFAARALGILPNGALIEGGKYQALFLTNGQVYFGKLAERGDNYILTDIFYLQADSQATADSKNPQETADTSDNVKLIKLGSEVHGPEDRMIVNRDQVLFYENLKKDGKVSSSIDQYANKQ